MNSEQKPQSEPQAPVVASNALLDAGAIVPSTMRYTVTNPHDHDTLKAGDVVVLVADHLINYFLLRTEDMTLHSLKDGGDQYVHLSSNPTADRRATENEKAHD
ncbi:MAG: hypothetical protein WC977_07355 [Anaerovoracaceae bacterium]|jgi:hypothetical protein